MAVEVYGLYFYSFKSTNTHDNSVKQTFFEKFKISNQNSNWHQAANHSLLPSTKWYKRSKKLTHSISFSTTAYSLSTLLDIMKRIVQLVTIVLVLCYGTQATTIVSIYYEQRS